MATLVKTQSPLVPTTFTDMFDRFFNESVNRVVQHTGFVPQADVFETEEAYHIQLTVPGMNKEDLKVEVHEGILTISGERKLVQEDRKAHRVESYYGSFSRSFRIPEKAKSTEVDARYENGILHLSLPKDEEKTRKYHVNVQ